MILPSVYLDQGYHPRQDGGCVMEWVSLFAGETWSDHPTCTHEAITRAAIRINDSLPDDERQRLVPLIPRLLRAGPPRDEAKAKRVSVRLAVWAARQVLLLVREQDRDACERAIAAVEDWLPDPSEANAHAAADASSAAARAASAASAAFAADASYAAIAAVAAADASYAAAYAAFAADASSAAARAAFAADASSAAARAVGDAADATDAAAGAAGAFDAFDPVMWLDDLLDAYDKALAAEGCLGDWPEELDADEVCSLVVRP